MDKEITEGESSPVIIHVQLTSKAKTNCSSKKRKAEIKNLSEYKDRELLKQEMSAGLVTLGEHLINFPWKDFTVHYM